MIFIDENKRQWKIIFFCCIENVVLDRRGDRVHYVPFIYLLLCKINKFDPIIYLCKAEYKIGGVKKKRENLRSSSKVIKEMFMRKIYF